MIHAVAADAENRNRWQAAQEREESVGLRGTVNEMSKKGMIDQCLCDAPVAAPVLALEKDCLEEVAAACHETRICQPAISPAPLARD
jgi:hypothetical protein